jgi:hypothetical protein
MKSIVIKSVLIGCSLRTLPLWPWWYRLGEGIEDFIGFLSFPGYIVGMVFSGGRVHDVNENVMVAASCVFYTALAYVVLRLWRKRKSTHL